MVATVVDPLDPERRAWPGEGWDGVVRIAAGGFYGTGTLLYDGRTVLTAAHLVAGEPGPVVVWFETPSGSVPMTADSVQVYPRYDARNSNGDLALVRLIEPAPVEADRYQLFRGDALGIAFDMVGYGVAGTGGSGLAAEPGSPVRRLAENRFDADGAALKAALGSVMAWRPLADAHLMADFDSGLSGNDALGRLLQVVDRGQGAAEGMLTPGDSGGAAFIQNQVAGVASYTASLSAGSVDPDIDAEANSSFGEIGAWMNVAHYQAEIDWAVRVAYPDAPTSRSAVQMNVREGDAGTSYAYFWVEYVGMRPDERAALSVDYATRDGTAVAGEDYLAQQGTLVLYPGESHAVVAVEVVGDDIAEGDETFYLEVFNPVGGGLLGGAAKLVAMRTIVDDDPWVVVS